MVKETDARAQLKAERIDYWLSVGAQPSQAVATLIKEVRHQRDAPGSSEGSDGSASDQASGSCASRDCSAHQRRSETGRGPRRAENAGGDADKSSEAPATRGSVPKTRPRPKKPKPLRTNLKKKSRKNRKFESHRSIMRFDIVTLFPQMFPGYLSQSLLHKAIEAGLVDVQLHDLRDWSTDKHKMVDDRPFGGGPGMVLKVEPVVDCVRVAAKTAKFAGSLDPTNAARPKTRSVCH